MVSEMGCFFLKDSDVYKFHLYSSLAYATNIISLLLRVHFIAGIPTVQVPSKA